MMILLIWNSSVGQSKFNPKKHPAGWPSDLDIYMPKKSQLYRYYYSHMLTACQNVHRPPPICLRIVEGYDITCVVTWPIPDLKCGLLIRGRCCYQTLLWEGPPKADTGVSIFTTRRALEKEQALSGDKCKSGDIICVHVLEIRAKLKIVIISYNN